MKREPYLTLVAGARKRQMADGSSLRILTAMELLEARREAVGLASREEEAALCANACILARAWERDSLPCFSDGEALLRACSAGEIARLAEAWLLLETQENPKLSETEERMEILKKAWSTRRVSAFVGACSKALGRCRRKRG